MQVLEPVCELKHDDEVISMDIMKVATELLSKQFGGQVSESQASTALTSLFGGDINIAEIVSKMSGDGNLGAMLSSWLGDGDNSPISAGQIRNIFSSDKLASFSQSLGVDQDTAVSGLSNVLPQLIDKSSSGGSMLDSVGGLGGAMDFAKKLF